MRRFAGPITQSLDLLLGLCDVFVEPRYPGFGLLEGVDVPLESFPHFGAPGLRLGDPRLLVHD